MKQLLASVTFFLAITLGVSLSYAQAAGGITVVPSQLQVVANSAEKQQISITVKNNSNEEMLLRLSREPFSFDDKESTPLLGEIHNEQDASSWVRVPETMLLAPNLSGVLTAVVDVPNNTKPGGYYVAVVLEQSLGVSNAISTRARLAVPLFISVDEKNSYVSTSISEFKIAEGASDKSIELLTTVKNEGNTHVQPTARVTFLDANGIKVPSISQDVGSRGDHIVVAPGSIFLPGSEREIRTSYQPTQGLDLSEVAQATVALTGSGTLVDDTPLVRDVDFNTEISELYLSRDDERSLYTLTFLNTGALALHPEVRLEVRDVFGDANWVVLGGNGQMLPVGERYSEELHMKQGERKPWVQEVVLRVQDATGNILETQVHYIIQPSVYVLLIAMIMLLALLLTIVLYHKHGAIASLSPKQ